jgi:hypothetical protein
MRCACRCGFELALKWYTRAFNPLQNDCAWMNCPEAGAGITGTTVDAPNGSGGITGVVVGVEGGADRPLIHWPSTVVAG